MKITDFCCSWASPGRSWATFGRSGAAFGRSWAALGRSWAALGTTFKNHQKIDAKNYRFGPPKASQKPPKMTPKSDQKTIKNRCSKSMPKMMDLDPKASQNDPQIEPKSDQKSMQKTKRKKHRTETVLGPSWGDLRPILASSWGRFW